MKYRCREAHEMKDSGVDWLGMIPKEWNHTQLKYLIKNVKNGTTETQIDSSEFPVTRIETISTGKVNFEKVGFINNFKKINDFKVNKGDILLSHINSLAMIGNIALYDDEKPLYHGMNLLKVTPLINYKFLYYFMKSGYFRKSCEAYAKPAINQASLSTANLKKIPCLEISKEEHEKIADFLDQKTSEFDFVIEKKEKLIKKLEEAKKSLISEVVTGKKEVYKDENGELKVRNRPQGEMKDSSVDWLGLMPKEWGLKPFKHILKERTEKNKPIKTSERLSLSVDKGLTLYSEKTTNLDRFKDDVSQYKLAHIGDLVMNSMNMIIGSIGVSKYFGCVSPVYYTYYDETKENYTSRYCEYLFKAEKLKRVLLSLGKGLMAIDRGDGKFNTIRLKVSREDLRALKLPIPNLDEQKQILKYLEKKIEGSNNIIAENQKQIQLIKEAKDSLISMAVTGKIEILG